MAPRKQDRGVARRLSAPMHALFKALSELRVPGMLFGGLASILHGVPRATRDVDATLVGGEQGAEGLFLLGIKRERQPR